MKNSTLETLGLGLTLAFLPLAGGCLQQADAQSEPTTAAATVNPEPSSIEPGHSDPAAAPGGEALDAGISDAPAKPISTEKPIPANLHPTGALSEMIRLAESGVDESIMLAFVTNSTATFSLGPEQIIYLNDIGVPPPVVSAMLQHDHLLVTEFAASARTPVSTATEPPEPGPPPAPEAPAPTEDYASNDVPGPAQGEPSDAGFYNALSPYGTWVEVGGYGRCWQPSVVVINHDWQPYADRGRWLYTDCGWYWMSDYSWGWAPFHYGRWFRHDRLGWCWAPDKVWGPSWVSWRYSNDYCGWAPLPPRAGFRPGLGFTYRGASVGFSFNFGIPASCYTFVPARNFCDFRVSRFALSGTQVSRIYNQTVAVNKIVGDGNRIVNRGIPADRIAAASHTRIRPVAVRDSGGSPTPGGRGDRLEAGGRALTVFRPHPEMEPRTPSASAAAPTSAGSRPVTAGIASPGPALGQSPQPIHSTPAIRRETERRPPAGNELARISPDDTRRTVAPAERAADWREAFNAQTPGARFESAPPSHAVAGSREVARERATPSIVRGSSRPSQFAASADSQRQFSRPSLNQNARSATTSSATHPHTRPISQWDGPRSVEGRPRYERPDPGYAAESSGSRVEVQNQQSTAPTGSAPEARHWQNSGPVQTPQIQPQRNAPAPNHTPQPQHSARETPAIAQPRNEARSAQPAPATLPAAPSHSNSSSDRRGR